MPVIAELIPHIYHERQEPGSMMCAQHALNNLMQDSYFTAADLSHIATSLDEQERGFDDDANTTSNNMDDTGFFSVQVLVQALDVWGLDIVGWRAESMDAYQDIPHTQLAFILNSQQHWYTLRRFGPASAKLREDEGIGHWFNLDSLIEAPQWIGKNYLDIQIQQAENAGYSVFAVIQKDEDAPLALSRTDADHLAASIPDNATASGAELNYGASDSGGDFEFDGMDPDEIEIQRALQASMMGASGTNFHPPPLRQATVPLPGGSDTPLGRDSGPATPLFGHSPLLDPEEEADPVAASMTRNQAMLQRMTAHQQLAQRELAAEGFAPRSQEEDYDEQLRRAIAESEVMARTSRQQASEEDVDVDMTDAPLQSRTPPAGNIGGGGNRNYDDEDAELQAALRASLENVPDDWIAPTFEPARPQPPTIPETVPSSSPSVPQSNKDDDVDSIFSEDMPSSDAMAPPPQEAPLDMDEIRRRRLARFGG